MLNVLITPRCLISALNVAYRSITGTLRAGVCNAVVEGIKWWGY